MELTITIRTIEEPDLRTVDSVDARRQKLQNLDEMNDAVAERVADFAQSFGMSSEYLQNVEVSGIVSYSMYSVVEKPAAERLPKRAVSVSRIQHKSFGLGQAVSSHQFLLNTTQKSDDSHREIIVLAKNDEAYFQWCKAHGHDPRDRGIKLVLDSKAKDLDNITSNHVNYYRKCELYGVYGWWENSAICNDWVNQLCRVIVSAGGVARPFS